MPYTLSGYSRLENYRCSGFWLAVLNPQIFFPRFLTKLRPPKIILLADLLGFA